MQTNRFKAVKFSIQVRKSSIIKWVKIPCALLLIIGASFAQLSVAEEQVAEKAFFVEDFEDGDLRDQAPVSWSLSNNGGNRGTIRVENGSCIFKSTETGRSSLTANMTRINDVSVRVQVRSLSSTGGGIFIVSHGQADGRSYLAGIIPQRQRVYILQPRGVNDPFPAELASKTTEFDPFEQDINIQFDCEGKRLKLYIWIEDGEKPERPTLSVNAPNLLPSGKVGVNMADNEIAIRKFEAIRIGNSLPFQVEFERIDENTLKFPVFDGYVLESSPDMTPGSWEIAKGKKVTRGLIITTSGSQVFFRLRTQFW